MTNLFGSFLFRPADIGTREEDIRTAPVASRSSLCSMPSLPGGAAPVPSCIFGCGKNWRIENESPQKTAVPQILHKKLYHRPPLDSKNKSPSTYPPPLPRPRPAPQTK